MSVEQILQQRLPAKRMEDASQGGMRSSEQSLSQSAIDGGKSVLVIVFCLVHSLFQVLFASRITDKVMFMEKNGDVHNWQKNAGRKWDELMHHCEEQRCVFVLLFVRFVLVQSRRGQMGTL